MPRLDIHFIRSAAFAALALGLASSQASAATLTRSIDVKGSPAAVWAAIGPYCAIATWHPAIGSCRTDGKTPATRTLLTRDGAKFVELQTARNDGRHSYSYSFLSAPVPVTNYVSTFSVAAKGASVSTVTWSGSYTPDAGKAAAASGALTGIYESGLAAIKAKLAK